MAVTRSPRTRRSAGGPAARRRRAGAALDLDAVGALAGVSAATVSRVINQPQLVAAATRTRVQHAIERSGYVPNRIAGGLASRRTGLIALIVPSIARSVFNDTIQAMTEELMLAGYQVMLALSGYGPGDIGGIVDSVLSRRPDGVILTGMAGDPALRRRLRATGVPLIETWELPTRPMDMAVGFSHARAGQDLADFVAARGYRRAALISASGARSQERRAAFAARWQQLGHAAPLRIDVPMPVNVAQGRKACNELWRREHRPDVIVCSSDWLALGVLIELRQHGVRAPEACGVVGFGNLDFAADLEPGLTTVHVDGAEIGRQSARLLMRRARGEGIPARLVDVGAHIIERQSLRRLEEVS